MFPTDEGETHEKKSLFSTSTLFAFVLTFLGPNTSHAATTCEDFLDNNVYNCHVKNDFGADFFDCFRFTNPGVQSSEFDMSVDGLGGQVMSCTCNAKGTLANPQFDASKDFHCVATGTSGFGIAFNGKATKTKIKKMQAVNDLGDSFLIECELAVTCPVTAGGNPYKR